MSLRCFFVLSLLISVEAFAQTPPAKAATGRVALDEKAYNEQLEKCKVDANANPVAGSATKPAVQGNSQKAKNQ